MNDQWNKLKSFRIGTGNEALSFIDRVARENRWTSSYAERVYQEYLRFLYLAANSNQPVTPSEAVDQVWHLHLCYSDSYWNELCPLILGKPLHHGPTKGGSSENRRFNDQYEATLRSYRQHFDAPPPEDIWPAPNVRFDPRNRFTRINERDVVVVRKSTLAVAACSILTLVLAPGCESIQDGTWADSSLVFPLILIAVFIGIILIIKKYGGGSGNGGCSTSWGGGGCGTDGGGGCGSGCGGGCGGS